MVQGQERGLGVGGVSRRLLRLWSWRCQVLTFGQKSSILGVPLKNAAKKRLARFEVLEVARKVQGRIITQGHALAKAEDRDEHPAG